MRSVRRDSSGGWDGMGWDGMAVWLTLRDDALDGAHLTQPLHCHVARVRSGSVQVRPAQETPGPVSLARFMAADELVVVDRSVRLVQGVGPRRAAVVGQARCDRYAGAGEEDGLRAAIRGRGVAEMWGRRSGEESVEGGDCAGWGVGGAWDDDRGR